MVTLTRVTRSSLATAVQLLSGTSLAASGMLHTHTQLRLCLSYHLSVARAGACAQIKRHSSLHAHHDACASIFPAPDLLLRFPLPRNSLRGRGMYRKVFLSRYRTHINLLTMNFTHAHIHTRLHTSPLTENVGVVRCCRDSCKSTRCTGYGACPDPEPTFVGFF